MKLLRLTVVVGLAISGLLLASPVDGDADQLLTDVDDDISRWNSLGRNGGDAERQDVKQEMGGRLNQFSNTFGRGFGSMGAARAMGGPHRSLVYRAIRTLDQAALVDPDDYDLASSVAAAYIAVAQVQGHPSHPNMGLAQESAGTYAKATRILARIQRQEPNHGRSRQLMSQARTSVYAYSRYPWYQPEVFMLMNLGDKEPGAPLREDPKHDANYGGAVKRTPRAGALGQLVEEVVQAEGEEILGAFGATPPSSAGIDLQDLQRRHATDQGKTEEIWTSAEDLHNNLASEGGLRSEAIRYLARLQIFMEEATAALEASDAGRAKANLTRAEYEISRLGKLVGVRP